MLLVEQVCVHILLGEAPGDHVPLRQEILDQVVSLLDEAVAELDGQVRYLPAECAPDAYDLETELLVECHLSVQLVKELLQQVQVVQLDLSDVHHARHPPLLHHAAKLPVPDHGEDPTLPVAGGELGPHLLDVGVVQRQDPEGVAEPHLRLGAGQFFRVVPVHVHVHRGISHHQHPLDHSLLLELVHDGKRLVEREVREGPDSCEGERASALDVTLYDLLLCVLDRVGQLEGEIEVPRGPGLLLYELADDVHVPVQLVDGGLDLIPFKTQCLGRARRRDARIGGYGVEHLQVKLVQLLDAVRRGQ